VPFDPDSDFLANSHKLFNPVPLPPEAILTTAVMVSNPYFPTTRDLPPSNIRKALDGLLNLIYPDQCFVCATPIARRQDCGICDSCWEKAIELKISPPRCSSCGLPFQSFQGTPEYLCGNCTLQIPSFSGARAFGYYTAELSRLIQAFKFHGRRNLVGLLTPLLAGTFFENWNRGDFDLVVPVPLHSKRRRERGYNQSELLARSLALQIALPCLPCLVRTRPTVPQVGLSDARRKENVRKAFHCRDSGLISGKRILLIDDVMTTGATVSSAAQTLMDEDALRVSVLTVARVEKW
jgi:ComF family protein